LSVLEKYWGEQVCDRRKYDDDDDNNNNNNNITQKMFYIAYM